MERLSSHDVVVMLLGIGVLLLFARALGEAARRFNQPAVIGEILAGVLLGPTALGAFAPKLTAFLFPPSGPGALVLNGLTTLAISLFLLVAGMEIDLSIVWRKGKSALMVGAAGVAFPFALGFSVAWFAPRSLFGDQGAHPLIFALFIAVALSITALPVIVRILMDLNLYRSELGMIIVAAAVFDDIVGWIVFATILGMMGASSGNGLGIISTIFLILGFTAVMLTIGRWLIHRILGWLLVQTKSAGVLLAFALSLGLFGAAFTEWIGVHAIFGSFLIGVAVGDSSHLEEQTRSTISQFIAFLFAPLFFASIGLQVDFTAHFNGFLVLIMLAVILIGKIPSCALGARLSGLPWREAWAIGSGMMAKGTMGIILGLFALQNGIINETLFVAIVVTSLITSMISGPLMQRILGGKRKDGKDAEYAEHAEERGLEI
jgi:Kef-type K+ transport system membrane component KefB